MSRRIRLGVNIDHIATLRNARRIAQPNFRDVCAVLDETRADVITVHLREDRRHIEEQDIETILQYTDIPLNLEIANTDEMINFLLKKSPHSCCLVPEKREELTTEGGLNIISERDKLVSTISKIRKHSDTKIGVFLEPRTEHICVASEIGIDVVEIHTGTYANAFMGGIDYQHELDRIVKAVEYAKDLGMQVHAGHGLNYKNVNNIVAIAGIEEVNIGFEIITEAIFIGLKQAINKMRRIIDDT